MADQNANTWIGIKFINQGFMGFMGLIGFMGGIRAQNSEIENSEYNMVNKNTKRY